MVRASYLLFGIVAYLVFLATFLYLVGFVADLSILPRTVDRPPGIGGATAALLDLLLVAVFGLQHSVMARPGFKRAWTRAVAAAIERSTYMTFACAALILLYGLWQPLPATLWDVRGTPLAPALWAVFGCGWLIVLLSTFLINHFELFGLRQVWTALRSRPEVAPTFREPLFYRLVRHPLYSGFFIAFWATPHMTAGHLLLSLGLSAYMLIAIEFEEKDLIGLFGADYTAYRARVGKLLPRIWRAG